MNKIFILDFGSGNTCKNTSAIIRKMIDSLHEVAKDKPDSIGEIVIKWQLFEEAGENIPLDWNCFCYAYSYAKNCGFKTTSSVFDKKSLNYLLRYDIPFVKISNRNDLNHLIGEVPRRIEVIKSVSNELYFYECVETRLCCVSEYPAGLKTYEERFSKKSLSFGISDHTTDWALFKKYQPEIYECHYKLEDSTGLDAGEFARTPEQLKELFDELR